ncbi:MAG: hypothetical protein BMS9Abin33_1218 [Gammaproteobacteria bacterium]|nr:MAG: hypothetical protein BMS9Abin33_1218 [Gammaproteobacteria bacterium]
MSKEEIQKYGRQDLIECASFWRNLIGELEIKILMMYCPRCEKHWQYQKPVSLS